MSRPWDVRELEAGNVRRLPTRAAVRDLPDLPTPGKLYRLPHTPQTVETLFHESSAWTQQVIRAIAYLGYDVDEISDEFVALTEVGKSRLTITLHHNGEMPLEIVRVVWGHESWTARQACQWLAKRARR
jgi:hypothetical protein